MEMTKKRVFNTARRTVTTAIARVANSLTGTVEDALLVDQCLRHCLPRRASSTVPFKPSVIFA